MYDYLQRNYNYSNNSVYHHPKIINNYPPIVKINIIVFITSKAVASAQRHGGSVETTQKCK